MGITYTNLHNLPAALAATITKDEKHSVGQLSVTQLLAPPRIRRLLEQNDVTMDVSERLWATVGKGLHAVLASHGKETELQIVGRIGETWISGTIDASDDGILRDWKMTSVYASTQRKDWEQQLNCYSWLMQRGKLVVRDRKLVPHVPQVPKALQITAIYRDWSKTRASGDGYPASVSETHDIPMWEVDEAERFIAARLNLHLDANRLTLPAMPPLCSDEERWHRPDTYAVMKAGRKRALRVLPSEADARAFAEHQGVGGLSIEHRPGSDVRCEGYCAARAVCPHGIAVALAAANNANHNQPNSNNQQQQEQEA